MEKDQKEGARPTPDTGRPRFRVHMTLANPGSLPRGPEEEAELLRKREEQLRQRLTKALRRFYPASKIPAALAEIEKQVQAGASLKEKVWALESIPAVYRGLDRQIRQIAAQVGPILAAAAEFSQMAPQLQDTAEQVRFLQPYLDEARERVHKMEPAVQEMIGATEEIRRLQPTLEAAAVVAKDQMSLAANRFPSVAAKELGSIAARNLDSIAAQNLSSIAAKNLGLVEAKNFASLAANDLIRLPFDDLLSEVARASATVVGDASRAFCEMNVARVAMEHSRMAEQVLSINKGGAAMSRYLDDGFSSVSALREIQDRITQWDQVAGRSLAQEMFETRTAAAAFMEHLEPGRDARLYETLQDELALRRAAFGDVAKLLAAGYASAAELDTVARSIRDKQDLARTLAEQYSEIDRFSAYALSGVDWQRFAGTFDHVAEIARGTAQFSLAYKHLQEALVEQSAGLGWSPYLEGLSAVEVFAHSNLLSSLTVRSSSQKPEAQEEEQEEEVSELRQRVSEEGGSTLRGRLAARTPVLLPLWLGAKAALNSDNPDRVRHYCVSQRELLLKLLDDVAPDDQVRKWTSDPGHYKDGRPTRRAKLLYINRNGRGVRYTQFVVKDVKVVFAVLENLNKGTHQVVAGFSPRELTDLQIRADNLLLFLLAMVDEFDH